MAGVQVHLFCNRLPGDRAAEIFCHKCTDPLIGLKRFAAVRRYRLLLQKIVAVNKDEFGKFGVVGAQHIAAAQFVKGMDHIPAGRIQRRSGVVPEVL